MDWLVWRRTRAAWPAVTASLVFIALGLVGPVPWTAAYKEDLLGVALAVGSIALLDASGGRRAIGGAALLAAAAVLTKQTFLGPAVAGTIWLAASRSPRAAALFAGAFLAITLTTLGVLQATGNAVFANTIQGNSHQPLDWFTLQFNLTQFAVFQTVPTLLAIAWFFFQPHARLRVGEDLLALNWLGALIPMLALGAIGADANYWLQLAAMSSMLAALTLWAWRGTWVSTAGAVLLGCASLVAVLNVASWLLARPGFVTPRPEYREIIEQLVDRVAGTPGTVLADPLDVVVLANRPLLIEPILYSLMELGGAWDSRGMLERVCEGEVSLLVLGYPIEEAHQRWPVSLAATLRQRFALETVLPLPFGARYVYVPRDPGDPGNDYSAPVSECGAATGFDSGDPR